MHDLITWRAPQPPPHLWARRLPGAPQHVRDLFRAESAFRTRRSLKAARASSARRGVSTQNSRQEMTTCLFTSSARSSTNFTNSLFGHLAAGAATAGMLAAPALAASELT